MQPIIIDYYGRPISHVSENAYTIKEENGINELYIQDVTYTGMTFYYTVKYFKNHAKTSSLDITSELRRINPYPDFIEIKTPADFAARSRSEFLKICCNIRIRPDDENALSSLHTWDMSECQKRNIS